MGLSTFYLVETRTQYIGIWLLVTCLRTLTSLFLYQQPPFVCVCVWFWHILLGEISTVSSFIHSQPHFLFFQRGFTSNKTQIHSKKKLKTTRKPISAVINQQPFATFATHAPYIFSFIFFPKPCLVVHPLHLLQVTTYLSHNVTLEMLPDLIMVAFRITHHTRKRLPVSMLTVVSQHRWQCTPQKANVQRYICKYIDELKRNERA